MSASSKSFSDIREIACQLAGVESIHPGQRPSPATALAEYLGCSVSHARHLLAGSKKPNPQMEKLLWPVRVQIPERSLK